MKHLMIGLLLTLVGIPATAQYSDTTYVTSTDSSDYNFGEKWMRIYSSLDMGEISTGFFLDRAINWVAPTKHQGILDENEEWIDDSNYYHTIVSIHESFMMARVDTSVHVLFDSTDVLRTTVNTYLDNGKVPVLGFYMNFEHIRDSAFLDSLIYLDQSDTSLHDVPFRISSPYEVQSVFVAAFGASEFEQGSLTFRMPSELYLSNSAKVLAQVDLKLGTESDWVTILPDSDLVVALDSYEGDYLFEIRYTYLDGTILISKNPVFFKKKPGPYVGPYLNANETLNISSNVNHGSATVTIAYGCGKTKLTKPFIIVEPFDPTNSITFPVIRAKLTGNNTTKPLIEELEAQGYDLVFIDLASNTDYLERNTELVKDVINQINAIKATNESTETNVMMGISMGGVLGRNALRTMELASQSHETSLFLSLDAPHRGAYIPISLQWAIHDLEILANYRLHIPIVNVDVELPLPASMKDPLYAALGLLGSPAAKQLLVLNIADPTKVAHRTFFNQYVANGPLEHCHEIALTNGSISGKKQQDLNGTEMPDGSLLAYINQVGVKGPWWLSLSGYITTADFSFLFKGLSMTNQTVYRGYLSIHIKIPTSSLFGLTPPLQVDLTPLHDELVAFGPAFDNAPGGFRSIGEDGIPDIGKNLGELAGTTLLTTTDKFCFVPTVSSLGISNYDLTYDVSGESDQSSYVVNSNTYYYYKPKTSNTTIFFKEFSAPITTSALPVLWNESHSTPTPVSGAVLPIALLSIPRILSEGLTTVSGTGNTFNFGYNKGTGTDALTTTGNLFYNDVTVSNYGKLLVNGDEPLGTQSSGLPDPEATSSFQVTTSGKTCDGLGKNITIDNTGELVLGSTTDTRSGTLRLSYGSTLHLKAGSKVTAYNNSKIVAGNGAIIQIGGTPDIDLDASVSKIEFEEGSILNIESGGTFSFNGDGFVAFEANHNDAFETIIGNGTFSITGPGKSHKVMEVNPPSASPHNVAGTFQVKSSLSGFDIATGKLMVNPVSGHANLNFQMHTPFTLDNATLTGLPIECFNLLTADYTDIQSIICYSDADVENCAFTGAEYGLLGYNVTSGTDKIKIHNSTFDWSGLYMYDCASDLNTLTFDGVGTLKAEAMSVPTIFRHIEMDAEEEDQNAIGIDYAGTGTTIELYRSHIRNAINAGVQVENAELTANCGSVTNDIDYLSNAVAINLKTDAILTLDPSLYTGAGHVDFSNYPVTIACTDADDVFLNNGYANLGTNAPGNGAVLSGTINAFYYPSIMNAEHNKWSLSGYLVPDDYDHYRYFYEASVDPVYYNRRAVDIGTANYLTSAPDIECLEGDGGGEGKRDSRRDGLELPLGAGSTLPFNSTSTLKAAVDDVFAMNGVSPKTLSSQLAKQASILTHNYGELEGLAAPAKNITYQKMVNTVAEAVADGVVKRNGIMSPEIKQLIDVQDHLLSNKVGRLTYAKKFDLSMDKAFTYRLAGRLHDALQLVNEVATWAEERNLAFVSKWQCQLGNEILLQADAISKSEFARNTRECESKTLSQVKLQPAVKAQPSVQTYTSNREQFLMYPNPASTHLWISLDQSEGLVNQVSILDISGRKLLSVAVSFDQKHLSIPIDLDNGTYFIQTEGSKKSTKKFVVVK